MKVAKILGSLAAFFLVVFIIAFLTQKDPVGEYRERYTPHLSYEFAETYETTEELYRDMLVLIGWYGETRNVLYKAFETEQESTTDLERYMKETRIPLDEIDVFEQMLDELLDESETITITCYEDMINRASEEALTRDRTEYLEQEEYFFVSFANVEMARKEKYSTDFFTMLKDCDALIVEIYNTVYPTKLLEAVLDGLYIRKDINGATRLLTYMGKYEAYREEIETFTAKIKEEKRKEKECVYSDCHNPGIVWDNGWYCEEHEKNYGKSKGVVRVNPTKPYNSSGSYNGRSSAPSSDPYDVYDYDDPEEFYDYNYDDFYDYDEAEEYYYDAW